MYVQYRLAATTRTFAALETAGQQPHNKEKEKRFHTTDWGLGRDGEGGGRC